MKKRTISFGTDGVRGVANKGLTPEDALGSASPPPACSGARLVLGRDTRLSGGMLSGALAAGAASGGARVLDLGVLPTPGVAALAPRLGATAAGVVSASHNPYPDNGIKFFSGEGRKLPAAEERELESLVGEAFDDRPVGDGVGAVEVQEDATELYVAGRPRAASPEGGRPEGAARLRQRGRIRGGAPGLRPARRGPHRGRRCADGDEHKRGA